MECDLCWLHQPILSRLGCNLYTISDYCLLWYGEKTMRNRKQTTAKATRRKFCVYVFPLLQQIFWYDTNAIPVDWIQCNVKQSVSTILIFFQFFVNIFIKIPWRCDWASLFVRILRYFAIGNFRRKDKNSFNYVFSGA